MNRATGGQAAMSRAMGVGWAAATLAATEAIKPEGEAEPGQERGGNVGSAASEDGSAGGEHHPVDADRQGPRQPALASEGGQRALVLIGGGGCNQRHDRDDHGVEALRAAVRPGAGWHSRLAMERCVMGPVAAVTAQGSQNDAAPVAGFGDAVLRPAGRPVELCSERCGAQGCAFLDAAPVGVPGGGLPLTRVQPSVGGGNVRPLFAGSCHVLAP